MFNLMKLTIVAIASLLVCGDALETEYAPISFNSDVRPILSENCFACHGPDEEDRAADLRLDLREPVIDYGALVEGKPDESLLIERVLSDDPDLIMPPPETRKTLSVAQKKLLLEWVRQGGEYQKHWSFEPLTETTPVPGAGSGWKKNSVDVFVAAKHQMKNLKPNAEADKATWLRRVTYDLTGLPPTLSELDAFLADESDNAYETVVERLLRSPEYGERMAVMWLDVARYADIRTLRFRRRRPQCCSTKAIRKNSMKPRSRLLLMRRRNFSL